MSYKKILDIGKLAEAEIRKLTPGQWVYADQDGPLWRGRFWGVKPSGTVVVAWQGNARNFGNWREYQQKLRQYATN